MQYANNSHGLLLIFTDITELKRLQLKLENQAYYDELTQIYNRRAFFQYSKQAFKEAKQSAASFTLLLLDIDYFKKVNDTYGHYAGDQVLVHVVKACQSVLPQGALFARYGGEEFVLTLKGYTSSEAEVLANQLRRHVETQPLRINEETISVTLSLGVAQAAKQENDTLDDLLNKADIALYAAKQNGRNQVRLYEEKKEMLKRT
ncbi:GGDEF domain-containing protein [Priestia megaterium]|uniref:GGDEF domain-containing protein n=1 Tax=Priestia megaterium TaxID=1404 RepID=UPI002877C2A1|nr:GGDEF domain-containing protein [Priestia megaterium]